MNKVLLMLLTKLDLKQTAFTEIVNMKSRVFFYLCSKTKDLIRVLAIPRLI